MHSRGASILMECSTESFREENKSVVPNGMARL